MTDTTSNDTTPGSTPGTTRRLIAAGTLVLAGTVVATSLPASAHPEPTGAKDRAVMKLDRRLDRFVDVQAALDAGYVETPECAESPEGAMGIHDVNPALLAAPPHTRRPGVLLYAPTPGGRRTLLGAEYFAVDADQDLSTDEDRPTLFGQRFDGPMPGHDPQMPVHYDLHVWTEQDNPNGIFAPWNPTVRCD